MADTEVEKATEKQAAPDAGGSVEVKNAQLPEAANQTGTGGGGQIDILLDTPMPVVARLGQVRMQVRQLLQLGPGSVITLDKQVGDCLLYTSPSPRDLSTYRMPSSA